MPKRGRTSRIVLGLNSGTSADGVDAVACEISGRGLGMKVRVIGHVETKYPDDVRSRLMAVMAPAATTTEELCLLHTAVGRVFAAAATKAMRKLGLRRVDLVGSHGQTICHLPPRGNVETPKRRKVETRESRRAEGSRGRGAEITKANESSSGRKVLSTVKGGSAAALLESSGTREVGTLQIGDATLIAAAVGAPVVSDFRHADMAVGGQGAPLVPWTDFVLFRDAKKSRVLQNIGGIANLTWLPAGGTENDVIAFDCGPGNMVIDALVQHFTGGKQAYDQNGRLAARGELLPKVLAFMLSHPHLKRPPPKSCGREEFGAAYAESLLARFRDRSARPEDWIATATRFTAECIARAYLSLPMLNLGMGRMSLGDSSMGGMGNRRASLNASGNLVPPNAPMTEGPPSVARASARKGLEFAQTPIRNSNADSAAARASIRPLAHATHANAASIDEVIVCGGGASNASLMREISDAAQDVGVSSALRLTAMDEYGISTQAKECVSFAMLAAACVDRVATNLPRVTGAMRRVVLGQITSLSTSYDNT